MRQTIQIKANSYKEATKDLKKKVMKMFEGRGKGRQQNKFYCRVIGYSVIREVKPFKKFSQEIYY